MRKLILLGFTSILLWSCNQNPLAENKTTEYTAPAAGTVIDADSMDVSDALNKLQFKVVVKSTGRSNKGTYDVFAQYGYDTVATQFTMPKGGEHFKPLLKKDKANTSFTIGFNQGDDTTFYEYYLINGDKGQMEMKYLKAYSFQ